MFALLLTSVLAGSNRTQTEEKYWSMWQDFQASGIRWLPDLLSSQEHDERFEIFMDNVDRITEHNRKGLSWTMGVTPFADMTGDEFGTKVIGNFCKDKFTVEAKKNRVISKLNKGRRRAVEGSNAVDWRQTNKVTRVKNQEQCGSCWAFSTTGSIEARTAIKNDNTPIELSEQELVDCSTKDAGCNGGSMLDGFLYAEQHSGLCLETAYVYTASDGTCKNTGCTHYDPVRSYASVTFGESYLEEAVIDGPVSVAIEADQMSFQLYSGGVFDGDCGSTLDHGVLIVGYDSGASSPYWIMKNSWGAGWGESGYMRMCKDCGKNAGAGQCGVASDASYPVI